MNMSSSAQLFAPMPPMASAFLYRDVAAAPVVKEPERILETEPEPVYTGPTPEELSQRIAAARAEAATEIAAPTHRSTIQSALRAGGRSANIQPNGCRYDSR